jgi:hypothetical protein
MCETALSRPKYFVAQVPNCSVCVATVLTRTRRDVDVIRLFACVVWNSVNCWVYGFSACHSLAILDWTLAWPPSHFVLTEFPNPVVRIVLVDRSVIDNWYVNIVMRSLLTRMYIYLSIYLYVYVSICLYLCLSVYLYSAVLKRLTTPSDFHTPWPSVVPFAHS